MLKDERLERLAKILLQYSLGLAKGDIFQVSASIYARPLVEAVFHESATMGLFPIIRWQDEGINRLGMELLNPEDPWSERFLQLNSQWELSRWQDIKANLSIRAPENDQEDSQISGERLRLAGRYSEPVERVILDQRRWVLFYWPTPAQAQKAGMPSDDYFDFALKVSLVDYDRLAIAEEKLKLRMERTDQVRILAPGTDIGFSLRGIPAVCCCGLRNVPDGEVYTAPLRTSVDGQITYNVPTNYWGRSFNQVALRFNSGAIVEASCQGDAAELNKILDTDEGARHIGEFSLGVNPLITRPVGNILFDEKITGSLHLTPGRAYARADNGNHSLIHWDLIQIQTAGCGGGEVWFDGELIRRDGLFVPGNLQDLNPDRLL
jgi:aminopeptidase